MNGGGAESMTEPSPELAEMFREQLQHMRSNGESREQAERTLLRFSAGRQFLGLLDEVYSEEPAEMAEQSGNGQRKGRVRSFFTR